MPVLLRGESNLMSNGIKRGVRLVYHGIDLRIEDLQHQFASWQEAFTDGFAEALDGGDVPYDDYKIVKGCKCRIELKNSPFEVHARNLAVVFYRGQQPVRVLLASILSDFNALVTSALSVAHDEQTLGAYLRNNLACRGQMVFLDTPIPADAFSPGAHYEPPVHPFGSAQQLFVHLKPKIRVQRPTGGFNMVDAKYRYRKDFQMRVNIETDCERFENYYAGALICRNEEALYPLLQN